MDKDMSMSEGDKTKGQIQNHNITWQQIPNDCYSSTLFKSQKMKKQISTDNNSQTNAHKYPN